MALGDRRYMSQTQTGARVGEYDEGLRKYMLGVYNYMSLAMGITGLVAFFTAQSPALLQTIYGTPLQWLVMLAPLGFVMFLSFRVHKMSASAAQITFWLFSAAMGLSLAYIFVAYTGASIARMFFITAGAFAGLSLVGYTTKKDLSAMGSFLFMGLIGIILASVVNIFVASAMIHWIVSIVGVLVFAGLTAYDTQQVKNMYYAADSGEVATKKSIMGALRLYLDFLNMFLFLLQLFGNRN